MQTAPQQTTPTSPRSALAAAAESTPLVAAKAIAEELAVSTRYIHMMAERGEIPCVRFGIGRAKKCVRFDRAAVMSAIGRDSQAKGGAR